MDKTLERQLAESRWLKYPMQENEEDGGLARWLQKEVRESRSLPLAADFHALRLKGPGTLSVSADMTVSGEGSVLIETATSTAKREGNRVYANTVLMRPLYGEDIRRYNRFSVWVYMDAPNTHSIFLALSLHNAGEHISPTPGRFEGTHHETLLPGRWQRIIWEMPDIYRDRCTGFSISAPLPGALPGGDERVRLYLDDMRLETVEAENTRGFALRKQAVAYCHSGYLPGARKQALVQGCAAKSFALYDEQGAQAFAGDVTPLEDGFSLLDFSALERPGRYTIQVGEIASKPFAVGPEAYLAAAWKTLNFFYCERCGYDVPGIHGVCHQDIMCKHPDGRSISVCGGWHDAADLTQGLSNTAESGIAMLALAEAVKDTQPGLYERLIEEARWGLGWVMRTRFGDGHRHPGTVVGYWTQNMLGDKDDMTAASDNRPYDNLIAAQFCAKAYPHYQYDRVFANWCLNCALEDFAFAREQLGVQQRMQQCELYAQAAVTAVELHKVTGDERYIEWGAQYARRVRQCQQLTHMEGFSIPLRGFFYEDETKARVISWFHRSCEHTLSECFTALLEAAPEHADAALWRDTIALSAEYMRGIAGAMPPYGILPAGIYEVDNTDYSKVYHEGTAVGLPTLEEYNAQVRNGIRLTERFYLRRFPVAYQFRGFHGTLMSKARAAFLLARALGDKDLRDIAVRQMEYVLGFNPFAMSTVYGEGYDYPPLYGGFAGNVVGAVPVGIETFENDDEPYMPMQSNCTYKEIWVHTTCRLMWLIAEAYKVH